MTEVVGTIPQEYRCLVEILTCPVCSDLVNDAHICPNCSKFYCLSCISKQLCIQQKCLNCNRFLNSSMLTNCQKLCTELTQTLQKVKQRGVKTNRSSHDKSPYYCYRHKLQKTYYCQTCDRPLCSDCSVLTQTHRGHEFIKLSIIKANYQQKMDEKIEELKTCSQNIERKMKGLKQDDQELIKCESNDFNKIQTSMKSLRDQLRKKMKKTLNQGQKKLDIFNGVIEGWSQCYEQGMNILRNTSKGKFIQEWFGLLQQKVTDKLQGIKEIQEDMVRTCQQVKQKNTVINYINPSDYTFVFLLQNFREKRKSKEFFYTEIVTTNEGLQFRLKVYPNGAPQAEQGQQFQPKMIKKHSKNDDYMSIFIELTDGPVSKTKQKHKLILNSALQQGKTFVREFESQFDVGLCWGYDHFIKISQLYDQGYYNQQFDFIEVTLKIGPCTYYQATKDQLALIKIRQNSLQSKKEHILQLQTLLGQKQDISTSSIIELA